MCARKVEMLTFDDSLALNISQVKKIYKQNINPPLVEILSSFGPGNDIVKSAEGVWLDISGNKILDMTGGLGVLNHGHNNPKILEVRKRYQDLRLMEPHKNHFCQFAAALANNLEVITPDPLKISFFCNSGAEAVDGAIKLAFKSFNGKRNTILHSNRSFHGKTIGAGSISYSDSFFDKSTSKSAFPEIQGKRIYRYNDVGSVEAVVDECRNVDGTSDIYAIFVEPFSASTVAQTDVEFLERVRDICDKEGIVLVFDEIYTGFAKTGPMFNFMRSAAVPDVLTISKSLGGGKSSISAYVTTEKLFLRSYGAISSALMHSTTYNGFGEECATAVEAINICVNDKYDEKAAVIERHIKSRLTILTEKNRSLIKEWRGAGALFGIVFSPQIKSLRVFEPVLPRKYRGDKFFFEKLFVGAIVDHMYRQHKCLTYLTQNREVVFYVAPSLVAEVHEIDHFFDCLEKTLLLGPYGLVARFVKNRFTK